MVRKILAQQAQGLQHAEGWRKKRKKQRHGGRKKEPSHKVTSRINPWELHQGLSLLPARKEELTRAPLS